MMNYFSFSIKNLKRRGVRSWLTLLGIFIGVAAVISLITLGSGLKEAVNAQFGVSSTQVITVQAGGLSLGPPGSTVVDPLTREDAEAIEKLSSVEIAIPRNVELVKIEYNDRVDFGYAATVEEGFEREMYELVDLKAAGGRMLSSGDLSKIVVGHNYADGEGNGFDEDVRIGRKILIEDTEFTVIGILERKGSFIIDNSILMYNQDLDSLVEYGNDVSLIAVKVKDRDLIDRAKQDIEKLLRDRRNVKFGEEDFEVSTPEGLLEQVNSVLGAIQVFIILIASISILVGAIGIINTMTASALERKKEIGIMKSIGARNSQIFMQFFVESGLLGLIGGLIGIIFGLIIGYLGVWAINNFIGSDAGVSFNIILIILSLMGSFLIGAVAGIIPAMNAAKQNPVEAIR